MESSAQVNKQKNKFLPKLVYFKENVTRFLIETSLNGLKYIADVKRNVWERGYYFISFSIVFTCGLYMVYYFLQKWQSTPVIISMGSKPTSVQDVPFPSVTFCNMNQALASKIKDIQPDTPEYAMLQTICFQNYNYSKFENFKPRFQGDSFVNFKLKNSQSCRDMLIYCKFGPYEAPCANIFREIFLDEGICCVFNRLHPFFIFKLHYKTLRGYDMINGQRRIPVDWNVETGYTEPLPRSFYPRKAPGLGVSLGLTVILNASKDEYFCSSTNGAGFKVLLTNPLDSADIKDIGLPIMLGHQTRLRINAKRLESDLSLRKIKVKDRQCYFWDEKKMLSFKHYTRSYCEAECDARQILVLCKCVPYHMPQLYNNVTKCFLGEMVCVENATRTPSIENLKCKKGCLPGCHDLMYYPDLYATPLAKRKFNLQNSFFRNLTMDMMQKNLAMIEIFYQNSNFRANIKLPYTGLTEFLSQTGGVMSLMVGFSVISIAEIFYFVLMKPFIDMFMKRNPLILESKDAEVMEKNASSDTTHPHMLFKRRQNIKNRIMHWDKNELQKYCKDKY